MTTKSDIARHLQVDPAAVTRWHRRGMPCHDPAAALAWHQSHIRTRRRREAVAAPSVPAPARDAASAGDPPTRSWRDRLDKANAETREAELAELRGRLLDVTQARREFWGVFQAMVGLLDSFPQRYAHNLVGKDVQGVYQILVDGIYQLRLDVVDSWEARSRSGLMSQAIRAMQPLGRRDGD